MKPISLQMYSLREEAAKDLPGTLKAVAAMGYKGVESGAQGLAPAEFRKMVEDLGMVVSSTGAGTELDGVPKSVEAAEAMGTYILMTGFRPDDFADADTIKATAEKLNALNEAVSAAGKILTLHNHYWEFDEVDGRLAYDILMEQCPDVQCELDIYWAANFGAVDPAEQVAKYAARLPVLHVKDGPLVKDQAHTAVGAGKVDVPKAIAAADESVLRWLVVELDNCDTNMTEAVAASCKYLVGSGLAEGNIR